MELNSYWIKLTFFLVFFIVLVCPVRGFRLHDLHRSDQDYSGLEGDVRFTQINSDIPGTVYKRWRMPYRIKVIQP